MGTSSLPSLTQQKIGKCTEKQKGNGYGMLTGQEKYLKTKKLRKQGQIVLTNYFTYVDWGMEGLPVEATEEGQG